MPLSEENPYCGWRRVIDYSGNGPNNNCGPVTGARDAALEKGITINGLPIMVKEPSYSTMDIDNLDIYYEDCVIGGPGSFVVTIKDREKFKEAIRTKLLLEVANRTPERRMVPVAEKEPRVSCLIGEKIWQDRWGRCTIPQPRLQSCWPRAERLAPAHPAAADRTRRCRNRATPAASVDGGTDRGLRPWPASIRASMSRPSATPPPRPHRCRMPKSATLPQAAARTVRPRRTDRRSVWRARNVLIPAPPAPLRRRRWPAGTNPAARSAALRRSQSSAGCASAPARHGASAAPDGVARRCATVLRSWLPATVPSRARRHQGRCRWR